MVLFSCFSITLLFFHFTHKRYERITFLSEQIAEILHGKEDLDIRIYQEGELSILQSEIQKMTLQLRDQARLLQKDKAYLSDSIADIAHQLRTPMTSMNLLTTFLAKSELGLPQRLEHVRELNILLSRMDWLVTTLLKISQIDAGTILFKHERTSVLKVLHLALSPLEIPMELRDIHLEIDCNEEISFTGDLNWTVEALGNILKNAMEHVPKGGRIEILAQENPIFTEIILQDRGSGINPSDLPHIFERFYQGKEKKENSYGIGLALCRMILSEQDATIKATNRTEGGSRFTIRFYKKNV